MFCQCGFVRGKSQTHHFEFSPVPFKSLEIITLGHILLSIPPIPDFWAAALVVVFQFLEKILPNLSSRVVAKLVIAQTQVDT